MTWMGYFWLGIIILCVTLEANTVSLVSIWFALGALAALITAIPSDLFWLQLIVFTVASCGSLAMTRPLCKRYLDKRGTRTNADRNIGEIALCTSRIDNAAGTGTAHVMGKEWTARSTDGSVIPEGASVRVEYISGVKLMVAPANMSNPATAGVSRP